MRKYKGDVVVGMEVERVHVNLDRERGRATVWLGFGDSQHGIQFFTDCDTAERIFDGRVSLLVGVER